MFNFLRSMLSPYSPNNYHIIYMKEQYSNPVHISGLLTYKKKPRNRKKKMNNKPLPATAVSVEIPYDYYSGDWVEVKRKNKWFSEC